MVRLVLSWLIFSCCARGATGSYRVCLWASPSLRFVYLVLMSILRAVSLYRWMFRLSEGARLVMQGGNCEAVDGICGMFEISLFFFCRCLFAWSAVPFKVAQSSTGRISRGRSCCVFEGFFMKEPLCSISFVLLGPLPRK